MTARKEQTARLDLEDFLNDGAVCMQHKQTDGATDLTTRALEPSGGSLVPRTAFFAGASFERFPFKLAAIVGESESRRRTMYRVLRKSLWCYSERDPEVFGIASTKQSSD